MCVRLCLFSALSRRVGALQIPIIIISITPITPPLVPPWPYRQGVDVGLVLLVIASQALAVEKRAPEVQHGLLLPVQQLKPRHVHSAVTEA